MTPAPTHDVFGWLQVTASALTFLAALAALYVASRAPKWAAEWADHLRVKSDMAAEKHKLQQKVFTDLMRCRGQILHPDAIAALNLVEVAFMDAAAVRTAYRSFFSATSSNPAQPMVIIERYNSLIEQIARELGYADRLSTFDIQAGYYPMGRGTMDEAALADAEEKIARKNERNKAALPA